MNLTLTGVHTRSPFDVRRLFVIDGSVTPTSLGVNPQVTLPAIAEKAAEWLAVNFATLSS